VIADPCQIESNRGDVDDAEAREEAREAAQHEENLARQISRHQRRDSEKHADEKSDSREKLRRRRTPWKDLIPRLKLMYSKWWDADSTLSRKFSVARTSSTVTSDQIEYTLTGRLTLSRAISEFKHSRHIQYAFKLALGVMLLSLPGLLPLGSQSEHQIRMIRCESDAHDERSCLT
jgi:hypothetical protein